MSPLLERTPEVTVPLDEDLAIRTPPALVERWVSTLWPARSARRATAPAIKHPGVTDC
jgi:hypothetical protein